MRWLNGFQKSPSVCNHSNECWTSQACCKHGYCPELSGHFGNSVTTSASIYVISRTGGAWESLKWLLILLNLHCFIFLKHTLILWHGQSLANNPLLPLINNHIYSTDFSNCMVRPISLHSVLAKNHVTIKGAHWLPWCQCPKDSG